MKIKEISELTGLTKKTIRYYEAEGLLNPEKRWLNGREYRNYSQADVAQLEKIAALRRARFSVEEIRHIESVPADIPAVFQSYRQRLQREQRDLSAVLAVINNISSDDLTSEDQLIAEMRPATVGLPLPAVDLDPHFRYLDALEANLMKRNKKVNMTEDERRQRKIAANNAAMYAGFSVQNSASNNMAAGGKGGGLDIGNAQKIAAYNLLMNDRD